MAVVQTTLDELPPKSLLMEKLLDLRFKYDIDLVTAAFTDLRDCPSSFQESFMNAMTAIERGNLTKMKDSIQKMKETAGTCPGTDDYLDVYYLQSVVSKRKGKRTLYYITLLAYCAIQNQKAMMEILIGEGANLHLGNSMIGSPLSQVLVYSQHLDCQNKVEGAILELLLKGAISDDLNVNILHSFAVGSGQMVCICSPLELAILIQRIDAVKLMVKAGANPILADSDPNEATGVIHLFSEYYEFGTNHYISWLLQEHLLSHEIPNFIERVFEAHIFNDDAMEMFTEVGRHPAHALLTCGHEGMIKKLIEVHGDSMLTVTDANGKTALEIAAAQGDLESVRILLNMRDNSDKTDMAKALLVAAQAGHAKVVECILQRDNTLIVEKVSNDKELWKQAVTEELSCIFEVVRDLDQTVLVGRFDDNDNTLAHIAALTGNSKLFKVVFPLTSLRLEPSAGDDQATQQTKRLISLEEFAQEKIERGQFAALMWENCDGKTPLHLAIENNRTSVIQTLKDRVDERESKPCAEQNIEKIAWDKFWKEWGPKLLLYACSYGSVDTVKLLVKGMMCSPNYQLSSAGETPLSCAAKAGKDDIVNYLLSFNEVSIPKSSEHSPLILAATNGYTRSVRVLLKKGADVNEMDLEGFNCLMKAIERKHRDTVLAILSDAKQGLKALQFCNGATTPFRMLIEHMPDVAEWVLNKCTLSDLQMNTVSSNNPAVQLIEEGTDLGDNKLENNRESDGNIIRVGNSKGYSLENKFELLEDFQSYKPAPLHSQLDTEMATFSFMVDGSGDVVTDSTTTTVIQTSDTKWGPKEYQTSNHPLKLMVDFDRENLLGHPLVKELLSYKWKRVGIPGLVIYFTCYMIFLIFLTAFALVIPRPGPADDFCPRPADNQTTSSDNFTDPMMCNGARQPESEVPGGFLYFAAVFLILIAIVYLVFEALQMIRRRLQYLMEYENYIQVALFICSIIYVVPTGDTCWCTPSWKWQIGVLAVFLGWLNCIILLRNWPVWGRPAAMLLNVYLNFAKLVYLPILLILTFGFPFYMMFVEKSGKHEDFTTPIRSIWKVILQTSGDIDGGSIFEEPNSYYPVVGYALFIIFIIAMPILFNNFLIGMAVGETEEERRKARLASIRTKVTYIFEIEDSVPFLRKFSFIDTTVRHPTSATLDDVTQKEFQDRNNAVIDEIKTKNRTEQMSLNLRRLTHDMTFTQEALLNIKKNVTLNQKQTTDVVGSLREDMVQYQRQNKEILSACQDDMMKNSQTLLESITTLKSEMEAMKAAILQSTKTQGKQ